MIDQQRLADCLGRLDPGTRALLDLSLRRAIPDEQVAKVLGVEAVSIPPRRAKGIAQLAEMMEVPGPSELAALLLAIPELPESAWDVPQVTVPFAGNVSSARRARAFRRVAIAASPLVALGAVMAAVLVSSGSNHGGVGSSPGVPGGFGKGSGAGSGGSAAVIGGGGKKAGTGGQSAASVPEPRHGLPPGVQLSMGRSTAAAAKARRHAAAKQRHSHGAPASGPPESVLLAGGPTDVRPDAEPIALHTPKRHRRQHHRIHHRTPGVQRPAPTVPSPPVNVPVSQPVPVPAPAPVVNTPTTTSPPPVHVQQPVAPVTTPKPSKPTVQPLTTLQAPSTGDDDNDQGTTPQPSDQQGSGGGCSYGHHSHDGDGYDHHRMGSYAHSGSFTPPGLFKRRHGLEH